MKFSALIKRFIFQGALVFTIISGILALSFVSAEDSESMLILSPSRTLNLLAFSFFISLSDTLMSYKKLNVIIRQIIHPVIYIGCFICFILLPSGSEGDGFWLLVGLFAFIYLIVRVSIFLISRFFGNKSKNSKTIDKKSEQDTARNESEIMVKKPSKSKKQEYHSLFTDKK